MAAYVSLAELYRLDFEIRDVFVVRQKWVTGVRFSRGGPRPKNGIIYLSGATGVYTDASGRSFDAPLGSLVFLPEGSDYSVLNTDCALSDTDDAFLVEFRLFAGGRPVLISDRPFRIQSEQVFQLCHLVTEAVKACENDPESPASAKAAVYTLLSALARDAFFAVSGRKEAVPSCVEEVKRSVFENIPVEVMAQRCHVSVATLRRSFKKYERKSPKQYVLDARLEEAKRMLRETDLSLEAIAETLNLESGAYFCRLFKKKTGVSPGQWREETRNSLEREKNGRK